jgi:hypothetical protein
MTRFQSRDTELDRTRLVVLRSSALWWRTLLDIRVVTILWHVVSVVRKEILGTSERRVLEAYLKGERLKGYNTLLWRIRTIGLKAIIEGCERDLNLLRKLLSSEAAKKN